jgi:hypothetical protein
MSSQHAILDPNWREALALAPPGPTEGPRGSLSHFITLIVIILNVTDHPHQNRQAVKIFLPASCPWNLKENVCCAALHFFSGPAVRKARHPPSSP